MSAADYKQNFEQSLQRLGQINAAIEANIKNKQDFSGKIIQRLSVINGKVKQLGDVIRGLKEQLTNLQGQAAANNSQIGDKNKQVDGLTVQNTQLTGERDKVVTELDQLKQQYQVDVQGLQKGIDDCEQKLRQLTTQNETIIQRRDALDAELKQTGEQGTKHAEEIKNLTDQNAQQLQQKDQQMTALQEQNNVQINQLKEQHIQELQQTDEQLAAIQSQNNIQINQLNQEIAAKEAELNQKVTEVGSNATQLQAQIEQLTREKQEKDAQIAKLQGDITDLQNENQDLISRIIAATQAISDAAGKLRELDNPAAFNEAELDEQFKEIEASIQQISNSIQGNPVAFNQDAAGQLTQIQNKLPSDISIAFNGQNLTLGLIRTQLGKKPQTVRNTNAPSKYALALDRVRNAQTPEEVIQALKSNGVDIKNGTIYGGKKTKKNKKNKKQKGGYTYKNNLKRGSISTTASMRSSSGRGRGRGQTKRR
jgi:chromosome segregation ATPase